MTEENNTPNPKNENEDLKLTPEEEEQLKKKLEELRKRDPFVYR
jgi:hypothetical protein